MDIDKFLSDAYKELDLMIKQQEDDFVELFIDDYLSDFFVDDTTLKNSTGNYAKANEINKRFDDAYEAFIIPFLFWYAKKLIDSGVIAVDYFKSIGVKAKLSDVDYIKKAIGLNGKNIIKGSFLWNLGMMGELRQRFQSLVINAISSSQKLSLLIRNSKAIFKSTRKQKSALAKYYTKYAYMPINQTLNGASYKLAQQYGITKFRYAGNLVEKSRDFCIERAGNIYTIEQGKSWNNLDWAGKMVGVDFFIQCGGYACRHFLQYLSKNKEDEGK